MYEDDKSLVRGEKKEKRDSIRTRQLNEMSHMICERIKSDERYKCAPLVLFYCPTGSEVNIRELYEEALEKGNKRVAFPKTDVTTKTMEFYEIKSVDELKEGNYGILEPEVKEENLIKNEPALMLVPGVAFDRSCNRMGYGGGYYDRYIGHNDKVVTIGCAFELQLTETRSLPTDCYDKKLDAVITEENTFDRVYSYEEVSGFILNSKFFEKYPGVEISRAMMQELGNPQKSLKFIHVAGSNGKGSVCNYMAKILEKSGIRTGLFTSPHLSDFCERIKINDKPIPSATAAVLGNQLIKLGQLLLLKRDMRPTVYDYAFSMAMLYFKQRGMEYVVLETGLGGVRDSTNCIDAPAVAIITQIDLEHTAILGNTLEEIAVQKAGILKKGSRAVIAHQADEAAIPLIKICGERNIPFVSSSDLPADLRPRMIGKHQMKNAAAAFEAAKVLSDIDRRVEDAAIYAGIREAVVPGRMEQISINPFILIDAAHNPAGVKTMVETLKEYYPGEKFIFYTGVMSDKDYEKMIDETLEIADIYYTLPVKSERSLLPQKLEKVIKSKGKGAITIPSAADALERMMGASPDRKTVVFGSIHLIGEIRELYLDY